MQYLENAAQQLRTDNPQVASALYERLLDLVEPEQLHYQEKNAVGEYGILRLEMNDIDGSIMSWDRAKRMNLSRAAYDDASYCVCSQIAIKLEQGEVVAAERIFHEEMQDDYSVRCDAFSMIDYTIRGLRNRDGELLELGQKHFILSFFPPRIARIIWGFQVRTARAPGDSTLAGFDDDWLREISLIISDSIVTAFSFRSAIGE
jgi:hypothetical protein